MRKVDRFKNELRQRLLTPAIINYVDTAYKETSWNFNILPNNCEFQLQFSDFISR